MSTVAIFGGSGFIGRSISKTLSLSHEKILVLDSSDYEFYEKNIETYKCSIADLKSLPMGKLKKVDSIIYLISTSTPASSNIDISKDICENLLPFVNLLELTSQFKLKKFIFASSGGAIYSNLENPPFSERCILGSQTSYGIVKAACESYLKIYAQRFGFLSISLRMSNPYGPGQLPKPGFGVVPTFVNSLLQGEKIKLFGEGGACRDFIYIDDVVKAFQLALTYKGGHEVFNIGSGEGVSIKNLLSLLELKLNIHADKDFLPSRVSDKEVVVLNIQSAKSKLIWSPDMTLSEGLDNYILWYRDNFS